MTRTEADVGVSAPLPSRTAGDVSDLLGTWLNTDRGHDGGILRMALTEREGQVLVRVTATGDPEPLQWGEAPAVTYTTPNSPPTVYSFTASYDLGFLRAFICAYYKTGILVATTYNVFTDRSGRADYWTREFFHRQQERP